MAASCHFCHEPITRHEDQTEVVDEDGASRTYHDHCHELDIAEYRARGERLPEDEPADAPIRSTDRRALNWRPPHWH